MSREDYRLGAREAADIAEVKANVVSDIESAQIDGLSAFNLEERAEWLDGIEACETLEIALEVYGYLNDFVRDGMEVVAEIQKTLKAGPLAQKRRTAFLQQAQISTFDGKQQMVDEIEGAVDEAQHLQGRTLKLISDQALSVQERAMVTQKMNAEGASSDLVKLAEEIVGVAHRRVKSRRAVLRVEGLLRRGEMGVARKQLNSSLKIIPMNEYTRLEDAVSQLQIKQSRLLAA